MNLELGDLQGIVNERNLVTISALECATFILNQVRELPLNQRVQMIELVRG